MSHAWTHSWCKSPSRDEAVRAAEDGRSGPLPTLEEAIGMLPKSASASPSVEPENKGERMTKKDRQAADYRAEASEREAPTGLRTERITLEITGAPGWTVRVHACDAESVRVVDEGHFDDLAQVAMERDAAIRDLRSVTAERAKLEEQLESVACRAATAEMALKSAPAASGNSSGILTSSPANSPESPVRSGPEENGKAGLPTD